MIFLLFMSLLVPSISDPHAQFLVCDPSKIPTSYLSQGATFTANEPYKSQGIIIDTAITLGGWNESYICDQSGKIYVSGIRTDWAWHNGERVTGQMPTDQTLNGCRIVRFDKPVITTAPAGKEYTYQPGYYLTLGRNKAHVINAYVLVSLLPATPDSRIKIFEYAWLPIDFPIPPSPEQLDQATIQYITGMQANLPSIAQDSRHTTGEYFIDPITHRQMYQWGDPANLVTYCPAFPIKLYPGSYDVWDWGRNELLPGVSPTFSFYYLNPQMIPDLNDRWRSYRGSKKPTISNKSAAQAVLTKLGIKA